MQDFLTTFDSLTDSERLDLASEILKRIAYLDFPLLSDKDLTLNAEKIFLQLDESNYDNPVSTKIRQFTK